MFTFCRPSPFSRLLCHHSSLFLLQIAKRCSTTQFYKAFLLDSFSVVLIVILIMSEKRKKTQVALTLQQRSEIVRLCDAQVNFAICEHNSCDIQSRMFVYSLFHRFFIVLISVLQYRYFLWKQMLLFVFIFADLIFCCQNCFGE